MSVRGAEGESNDAEERPRAPRAPRVPRVIERSPDEHSTAHGLFLGFALLALTQAFAICWFVPLPRAGLSLRLQHCAFDVAETLGLGALASLCMGLFVRYVKIPHTARMLVYAAASSPIVFALIGSDLYRQAYVVLDGRPAFALYVVYVILCGFALPAAHGLGALVAERPRLRFLPAALALAAMVGNHFLLRDDYFGVHGIVAWASATLVGASLAASATRVARALSARRAGRAAALGLVSFAALGLCVPPGNAVRLELFREPCSLAWVYAATTWRAPSPESALPPSISPWLEDRAARPPTPPSTPRRTPRNPIVVLVTIDALRADVVDDPENDRSLPTLSSIKRLGVHFSRATSPGSQTSVSLTTTFSGRYFSQLHWSKYGHGPARFLYAADDPTPRFPEILAAHGVKTAHFASLNFLANDYGVVRGFTEERVIARGRQHAQARYLVDPALARLSRAGNEPLFLYLHLTEPHAPYDRGAKKTGTPRERYLSEVAVADAQLGRIANLLRRRFPKRGVLIVAADHGEAFGEHDTHQHTKTLYDELLHIPLLVEGRGLVPRRIDQRVGLIDIGPTILDLFGIEAPSSVFGQSLLPLLEGRKKTLDRPIFAEGRLRRALYFGDELKVIDDPRRKVVEVYDLARDPGETRNIFEEDKARSDPALAALRAFFAAHELRKPGYRTPYKP